MIKLTKEQILLLHTQLIETTGGSDGFRDMGLLESALESPFQSYGGEELYPSIQAKAARLCYGLVISYFSPLIFREWISNFVLDFKSPENMAKIYRSVGSVFLQRSHFSASRYCFLR